MQLMHNKSDNVHFPSESQTCKYDDVSFGFMLHTIIFDTNENLLSQ